MVGARVGLLGALGVRVGGWVFLCLGRGSDACLLFIVCILFVGGLFVSFFSLFSC